MDPRRHPWGLALHRRGEAELDRPRGPPAGSRAARGVPDGHPGGAGGEIGPLTPSLSQPPSRRPGEGAPTLSFSNDTQSPSSPGGRGGGWERRAGEVRAA